MHPSPAEEISVVASVLAAIVGILLFVQSFRPPDRTGRSDD